MTACMLVRRAQYMFKYTSKSTRDSADGANCARSSSASSFSCTCGHNGIKLAICQSPAQTHDSARQEGAHLQSVTQVAVRFAVQDELERATAGCHHPCSGIIDAGLDMQINFAIAVQEPDFPLRSEAHLLANARSLECVHPAENAAGTHHAPSLVAASEDLYNSKQSL